MITNLENDEGVMMLDTQYRMASSICEWPSKYFYGGKLMTAESLLRNGPCFDYRYFKKIYGCVTIALDEHRFFKKKNILLYS
jgi:hypothetical protein